jgi:gliding motility-associated-like protein
MRLTSFSKLLILLPLLFLTFFATGQDTLFTYLFEDGLGSPCAPVSMNFYSQSNLSNPIYDWKVNGISFSNQAEPIRVFLVGGNYNICLDVVNGSGGSESYCEEIFIFDPPAVILDNDTDLGCSPLAVTFTLTSTTNIDSVIWDLGDGTVISQNGNDSTSMIYDHIYIASGDFSPILTVFDEHGCESTITESNTVEVINTPNPTFIVDEAIGCTVPHTVNFTNTTAMSGGLEFYWDFGVDTSSNSSDINPTFTYTSLGSYDVTLVVTNTNTLCSDTLVIEDFINIGEFNGFQYELLDDGSCGLVQVAFSFYNSENIQSVVWDFGDGNSSSQQNPVYIYTSAGCFSPSLTIVTTDGCTYNVTAPECIKSNGPVSVDYTASGDLKTCDPLGTEVIFNGISTMATSWLWVFGGLGTSTMQNPVFNFTEYGTYPVELTVTYADGCEQSVVKTSVIIEPLEAAFSSNVADGCEGLQVFFSNETNAVDFITSYQWDFGGGIGLNNIANPVVSYPNPGSYDVSLMVETVSGCLSTVLIEDFIEIGFPTNPGFSADPLVSCLEDPIQFTDESGLFVDEWEWYFGDGGQSGGQDPQHEYTDTGFFDLTLITFVHGCPDTLLVEDYIYINAPKAEFSFDQDCSMPGEIQFYDASAGAETWSWTFGDGGISDVPSPSHVYAGNGSYLVTLTVYNSQIGCEHSQSMTVNVTTSTPEFTLSDLKICTGDTISVINNSVGADCYTWTFPAGVGMITNSFCDPDPQFYIPVAGCYGGFSLTITNGSTCSNTYYFPDTVYVSESVADFANDDAVGCSPHIVNFANSAYGVNGSIVNYSWDFGDTNTSTDPNPTHTYTDLGYHTVGLTVENETGCTDELIMDSLIFVDKIEPFFIPQVTDCSSQSVAFVNATSSYHNDLTYLWDFGDASTSTSFSPNHSYASIGDYLVCLTATNAIGCSEQICDSINFQPLAVDFTADNTYKSCPLPPLVSNFTDLSINATSWSWDFGDNANSGLQNPAHSYSQTGYYTVCLTITNEIGCSETECKTDYVIVDGPSGTFTADVTSGCADLEVQFIVQSENAFKYTYDFGDGFVVDSLASGDADTITYTYTNGATYAPLVLLEDASGCQIPVLGPTIYVEDIFTDFAATINEVCEGANTPIDFLVAFADPSSVISVDWEFSGSNTPIASGTNPEGVIYNQPGYYDVVLNANTTFCQATITTDSFIYVHPKSITNFIVTPSSACSFETLSFEDQSSVVGDSIISWNWIVDNNTFTDTNFTYQFTSAGDYVVTLETTSGFGCISNYQQTVSIFENPQVDAGENVFLCADENSELFASIPTSDLVTYSWTPVSGLSCLTCPNPIADPVTTTQYYVTATSLNGCFSTDSVLVEVSILPELEIYVPSNIAICEGGSTSLTSSTNHTAASYNWDTSQLGLSCYNCADPIANPITTTTYTVTILTTEGCSGSNSTIVEVIDNVDLIDLAPVICIGESIQLEVLLGGSITWAPAIGLSCTNCPNPVASPTTTTTYTVTALLQNQCIQTDEVTVSVLTKLDIDAGDDLKVCAGDSVTMNGSYPSGTSEWLFNGQVLASNTLTPTIIPTQTGYYVLEVTHGNCILSDTLIIKIRNKVEFTVDDVTICEGDTAFLFVIGDIDTYEWIDSPGVSDPTSSSPFVIPTETSIYTIAGSSENCESDIRLVTVEVLPIVDITLPMFDYFVEGETIQLDAVVIDGDNSTYVWSPPLGLSCTDCPNPTVTPEENITYNLTVTNELGCSDSVSIFLEKIFTCNDDLINVPNAFTPNGDGNNDRFNVWSELEIGMVRIYNRWGEIVFEDVGGKQGWDGNYKGQRLNRDVFVYYIEATCEFNGKTIVKTGDITLLR